MQLTQVGDFLVIKNNRNIGFTLVIIGAIFWGIGGTVSQKLFQQYAIDVNWLVSTRLLIAGILLLLIQYLWKDRIQIFGIWKQKRTTFQLVVFGLFGMLAVQYTFMASIHHGNAAVATLLQYLAPTMIIVYLILRKETILMKTDLIAILLALVGSFLLLTNGSLNHLSVSLPAIVWGFLSAVTLAFYTLYAISLVKYYDSLVVVGWAMLIGGVTLSFIHPPWKINITQLPFEAYFYLLFVFLFGTMLAYWFYIESLNSLSPKETSLIGTLEPLAAVFATVFWLKESFGFYQWIGTACIVGLILLLTVSQKPTANSAD